VAVQGDGVKVRVWERGAGETMACGTGACAAVVAANEAGLVPAKAPARFPGGLLQIERLEGDEVLLTGPAVRVAEGVVDPAWLEAVAG
jgi:diaminopimelate epimerase